VFANVVLADEINRSSPRTLSCLLEAMESGRVSVEGRTLTLGSPFTVLATRNPIEFHGTYPLPEAVLDRFLVRVELGYPSADAERQLYLGADPELRLQALAAVLTKEDLLQLRAQVPAVRIGAPVADFAYAVVAATRSLPGVHLGASPRAALAWLRASRARALLHGRDYVLPDDLKALAVPTLAHRVFTRGEVDVAAALQHLVATTPVPL
jgi:MoxR-like ATPase